MFVNCVSLGEGGRNYPKKRKKPKKPVPNLKFAVAFGSLSVFSAFFGIFRFFVVLFPFFRSELRQKFQSFKNRVLGGQELPNNTFNAYKAVQMSYKSYFNQQEPLNKNPPISILH